MQKNKLKKLQRMLLLYGRSIAATVLLGTVASLMCAAFFIKAHNETAALNVPFSQGPLFPLLLFCLLIIGVLTLLFASLQTHAYWVRDQEKTAVEKSSFVRMASDTLRTPLTGIRWTTELMLSGEFGTINEEQKISISNMDSAIKRVIDLVNELLEVMRLSGGIIDYNAEPTDVTELIKSSVRDMTSVAGSKHIGLGFGQISHDVLIMLDAPLMRHVLSTLIAAAIHLAKKETVLVLHTEPSEKRIAIGITYKGEKMQFKNFDTNEKAIQKAALPTNVGNLDFTISWEILNTAGSEFWRIDKGEEQTMFISLPLVEAPKGSVASNRSVVERLDAEITKFLQDNADDVQLPTQQTNA